MMSKDQLKKFQEIWKKIFGRDISADEADRESNRLVRIVQLICKPSTKDKGEDIQKHREETEQ